MERIEKQIKATIEHLESIGYDINSLHNRDGKQGEERYDAIEVAYRSVEEAIRDLEEVLEIEQGIKE